MDNKILLINDFAQKEDILQLNSIYESSKMPVEANKCLEDNTSYYCFMHLNNSIFQKWAEKIVDLTQISMQMSDGGISVMCNKNIHYHADCEEPVEGTKILGIPSISEGFNLQKNLEDVAWKHNHCHRRIYSTVIYLNTIENGGCTILPQHNLAVNPVEGRLLGFPSNRDYVHGVESVPNVIRLAALLWFEPVY